MGRNLISLVNSAAENLCPEGVQACIAQYTLLQQTCLSTKQCLLQCVQYIYNRKTKTFLTSHHW